MECKRYIHFFSYSGLSVVLGEYEPCLQIRTENIAHANRAYNHFLHLIADTHALDHLNILQARKNLVLNLEACLHAESGALLDGERLLLELGKGVLCVKIDNNIWAALNLKTGISTVGTAR